MAPGNRPAPAAPERESAVLAVERRPSPATRPEPARLPMLRRNLVELFDHLDAALRGVDCDHSWQHTLDFLAARDIAAPPALAWLQRHGGRCDCTVLAHVEDNWLARA